MAVFRLRVMSDVSLPIGYGIPIILFVWLCDRRFLWVTAACFTAISATKFYRILPEDPHILGRGTDLAMQVLDLAFVATVVHVVIGLRRNVEDHNLSLT